MTRKGWTELDDLRKAVVEISVEDRTPENPTAFATTQDVARRLALTWGAQDYVSDVKLAKRHDQKIRKLLAELVRRGEIARLDSGLPKAHAKWTATNLGVHVDRSRRRENRGDGSRVKTKLEGAIERPASLPIGPQAELDFAEEPAPPPPPPPPPAPPPTTPTAARTESLALASRRLGERVYREIATRSFGEAAREIRELALALATSARIFEELGL